MSLLSMMALVPDTEAYRSWVFFSDLSRLGDLAGIDRPEFTDDVAVSGYIDAISEFGPLASGFGSGSGSSLDNVADWRREFGYSVIDASQDLVTGRVNPLHLAATRLSRSEIIAAIRADGAWSNELREVSGEPFGYFVWSDGVAIDMDRRSAPRPIGRGGTLTLIGDVAVRVVEPGTAEVVALTAADEIQSLADDADFEVVASELEQSDVYAALLSADAYDLSFYELDGGKHAETIARVDALPWIPRYRVIGIGQSLDVDLSHIVTLVFATESPSAAADTIRVVPIVFDSEFSDSGTIRSVRVDGAVAVVVIESVDGPTLGLDLFVRRAVLFRSK